MAAEDPRLGPLFSLTMVIIFLSGMLLSAGKSTPAAAVGDFSLLFDGTDDYASLGRSNSLFGGTQWAAAKTLSFWVKVTALPRR